MAVEGEGLKPSLLSIISRGEGEGECNLRAIIIISVCLRPQAKHKSKCWVFIPSDVTVWMSGKEGL